MTISAPPILRSANQSIEAALEEMLRAKEAGEARVILFNRCGHCHFDMQAYADYCAGMLTDQSYAEADLQGALAHLSKVA